MAAGDFTASALMDIKGQMEEMWMSPQKKAQYNPIVDATLGVLNEQTAMVQAELGKPEGKSVIVTWNKACPSDPVDLATECSITVAETESASQTYTIDVNKQLEFSVAIKKFRSNLLTPEQVTADNMLIHMAKMDEYINKQLIVFLEANEGVNEYGGFGTLAGTPTGSLTNVAAANMTLEAIPEFMLTGMFNRMDDPYILSGTNLYVAYQKAMLEAGNGEGAGGVAKANKFRTYFDPVTIDTALSPAKVTYLIDRGALALATRAYHPAEPFEVKGGGARIWYKLPSKNLPGVEYDVVYNTTCASDEVYHHFKLIARFKWLLNPLGCTATRTGILKFAKV